MGTIQFRHALSQVQELVQERYPNYDYTIVIPQVKPLSPGEVLGCTSPTIPKYQLHILTYYYGINFWKYNK